jgi:hypothetical protein
MRVRRLASIVVGALREHSRRGSGHIVRVTARIEGSVAQSTLRDLVLDQAEALRHSRANGGHATIRGHVSIQPDAADIRLDPVLSVLCASSVLVDFSLVYEDGSAPARRPEASPSIAPAMTNVEATWARLLDPHRRMAMYVKTAHPRAFIVAFSLPEDEDGFCDAALEQWLAPIVSFRRRYPMAAFCLLNRTMLLQCGRAVVEVAPIRSVGFGVHDSLALARMADAFVGGLDLYGVAALSTGRPGVYLDPTGVERSNEARDVWIVKHASEAECLARLEAILPRRRDSMSDR